VSGDLIHGDMILGFPPIERVGEEFARLPELSFRLIRALGTERDETTAEIKEYVF